MAIIERYPRSIIRKQRPIVRKAYPCKPKIRQECKNIIRPCPFVSCRYNMFLDVFGKKINTYFDDPTEMIESCALDIAEKYKGMRLEDIAEYLNLSRERIRQIQDQALRNIMLSGE